MEIYTMDLDNVNHPSTRHTHLPTSQICPQNRANGEQPQLRDDEVKTGDSELILKLMSCFILLLLSIADKHASLSRFERVDEALKLLSQLLGTSH